jgi:hypothetical protein
VGERARIDSGGQAGDGGVRGEEVVTKPVKPWGGPDHVKYCDCGGCPNKRVSRRKGGEGRAKKVLPQEAEKAE